MSAVPPRWNGDWNIDSRQLATLGISIPDIQKAINQYYQKEFLGTGNVETQLATSRKGGQNNQWIRLALIPENEKDGFNPTLITVLNKDGKTDPSGPTAKKSPVRKRLHRVITVSTV